MYKTMQYLSIIHINQHESKIYQICLYYGEKLSKKEYILLKKGKTTVFICIAAHIQSSLQNWYRKSDKQKS